MRSKKRKKKKVKKIEKAKKTEEEKKIEEAKLKMDFVSSDVLNKKDEENRIKYILNAVKDGTILVTDGVMSSDEELNLIRETMRKVDDGFPGIEVCSLKRDARGYQRIFEMAQEQKYRVEKILNRIRRRNPPKLNLKYGMTLIGPSKLIKRIKKNPDSFSVFAEV